MLIIVISNPKVGYDCIKYSNTQKKSFDVYNILNNFKHTLYIYDERKTRFIKNVNIYLNKSRCSMHLYFGNMS